MRTTPSPRKQRFFAVALVLLVGLGFVLSLLALNAPGFEERVIEEALAESGENGFVQAALEGRLTASFQSSVERELPFRDLAVALWSAFRYAFFREGARGVVVGTDDWLFTAEEFEAPPDYAERLENRLGRVTAISEILRDQGISLVVALVPAKARAQPQGLGDAEPPVGLQHRYDRALAVLREAGVPAPDLRSDLRAPESFLLRDTHWTPPGARRAARAVARAIRRLLDREGIEEAAYVSLPVEVVERKGDLLAFLPVGPFADELGLLPEAVRRFDTRPENPDADDPLGLFATPSVPVALIGTSYSADPLWNFGGFLQESVGAEVLTVAQEGEGAYAPMEAYLESDTIREVPPVVVVWEIPERYLTVDP